MNLELGTRPKGAIEISQTPGDRRYTTDHEWIKIDGDIATVGITDFAQNELGDVTYVEVPQVGKTIGKGESFGVVESVKAVSDLFAPLTGEVVEINTELPKKPETVNRDPYGQGWMIVIRMTNPGEASALLSAAQYEQLIAAAGH